MDPVTLLALANTAVAAVKKGCQLYKDIKGAAGQVKEVLDDLEKTFKTKHKDKPPSKAEVKQYNEERQRVQEIGKSNPDDVYADVGERLGDYFDAVDKIEELFYQEELQAQEVYEGDVSLKRRALKRVMIRTKLEAMHVEMREIMVYHSPKELGALWSKFEDMRKQIMQEQEVARSKRRIEDANKAFERQVRIDKLKSLVGEFILSLLIVLWIWGLLWSIKLQALREKALFS